MDIDTFKKIADEEQIDADLALSVLQELPYDEKVTRERLVSIRDNLRALGADPMVPDTMAFLDVQPFKSEDAQVKIPEKDIMQDLEAPADLELIKDDKLYQVEEDIDIHKFDILPNVEVTEFDPDAFKSNMEANASLSKATDDLSLDHAPVDLRAPGILEFMTPGALAEKAKDFAIYLTDPAVKTEVDMRAENKPIRLMTDAELDAVISDETNPNYNNAWNERNLRDRWSKQSFYENIRDPDWVKREEGNISDQFNSSLARIPGQAATLSGLALGLPEAGLRSLGVEDEKSPTMEALNLGGELNEIVNRLYRTQNPQNPIETAASVAGGVLPVGVGLKGVGLAAELATPLTFGGPGRAVANFATQFLGAEALRPVFAPEGDKYETIFQSFFGADEAVAETGESPLQKDYVIAETPEGTKVKNNDLYKFGAFGLAAIGLGVAPHVVKSLSANHIPIGKIVDAAGYLAPPKVKSFETAGDLMKAYLADPIGSALFSVMRRVGIHNDNLYHSLETNTQAALTEKIKGAIITGKIRTLDGDYDSPVPAGRVYEFAASLPPEQREFANLYIKLNDMLAQMRRDKLSRANGLTLSQVRRKISDIEAAFPKVKELRTMYKAVMDANKKFGGDYAPDNVLKDINSFREIDAFDELINMTHDTIKTKVNNTVKLRIVDAIKNSPYGASMFAKVTKKQLEKNPKWKERLIKFNRNGKEEMYVTTKLMRDIITLDPHYARSPLLYGTGRLFQFGTTGYGAPYFAVTQFFREAELGNQFAPMGYQKLSHVGPTVKVNGHEVGISIPGMQYARSLGGFFEQIARRSQHALSEQIYRDLALDTGKGQILKAVFGDDAIKSFADVMANSYLNSVYHLWASSGGQGVTMTRSAIKAGHTKLDDVIAYIKKSVSPYADFDNLKLDKLYRGYKNLIDAAHSAGQYSFFSKNYRSMSKKGRMNDAKLDALLAETRKLTGNLSISGRVYSRGGRKQISADAKGAKIVEATGPLIDLMRESTPWFNALIQGLRRTGIAYWSNPWRFQARLHTGLTLPMIMSYFTAMQLGDEYLNYMTVGRDERTKATSLYIPLYGKAPEEGLEIPMPLELAPLIYMQLNLLDSIYRPNNSIESKIVAKTILENFGDLTTPPIVQTGAGLMGVKLPSTLLFGGKGYIPGEDPRSPLPENVELGLRALMGGSVDVYISGLTALLEEGDVDAGLAEMAYKVKQKTPVVKSTTLGPFNQISEAQFERLGLLKKMEQVYDEHIDPRREGKIGVREGSDIIGYGPEMNLIPEMVPNVLESGKEGKKLVPDVSEGTTTILKAVPLSRAGFSETPPPTNPIYIAFATKLHDVFQNRAGNYQKSVNRLAALTNQVQSLQTINAGNIHNWKGVIEKLPEDDEIRIELEKYDLTDRDSVRRAINFFQKERIKTLELIEVLVREAEDQVNQELLEAGGLEKPVKLEDLDPYETYP